MRNPPLSAFVALVTTLTCLVFATGRIGAVALDDGGTRSASAETVTVVNATIGAPAAGVRVARGGGFGTEKAYRSVAVAGAAGNKPPAPASEKPLVVSAVTLVDVCAGRTVPDRTVVIAGGRIVRVGPSGAIKVPPGATVVEGRGRFLMPGLFDSHVHLNNPDREARMLVANGVTFVRDMGGVTAERIATRARARQGALFGMEMACVGTILDGDPPYHPWSRACGTPEEGRAAVREMRAAGVDQIKVYSLLKPEVFRAIVAEAKACGLKVVGHVPDSLTLEEAAQAGMSGVEHLTGYASLLRALLPDNRPVPGEFDSGIWKRYPEVDTAKLRERLQQLARSGTAQCPTLVLHAGQARIMDASTQALWRTYALPSDRDSWAAVPPQWAGYARSQTAAFPYLQRTVAEFHRAGVPLLVGTDLANPGILAGFSVHQEMRLWQQAGIPSAAVLRAATLTPARFLGVEDRLGTVEVGKTASLVLTRKNPLQDIRNAEEIEAVIVRGKYLDRAALDRLLAEAREDILARSPAPEQDIALSLPGTVVARGRYRLLYGPYDDGTEEFLITRDGDTYRFQGIRRQSGYGRYPTVVTGQWDGGLAPRRISLNPRVLRPVVETYDVAQGRLRGVAKIGDRVLTRTDLAFGNNAALRTPLLAMDYFLLRRIDLQVGEERTVPTARVATGTAWIPESQTVVITRQADEPVALADGQMPLCRHYVLRAEKEGAGAQTDIWVDLEGVPVRQVITEGALKRSAVRESKN